MRPTADQTVREAHNRSCYALHREKITAAAIRRTLHLTVFPGLTRRAMLGGKGAVMTTLEDVTKKKAE
jgi:hypothetical protein